MKTKVYAECLRILHERINALKGQISDLTEGAKNDSKSTAGDKHETARAMMQLEQEKLSGQLNILLQQERTLQWLDPELKSERVVNGCVVKTNQGYIYISIAIGKIKVDAEDVMCISPQSPLGLQLLGKTKGESAEINRAIFRIEEVC